MKASRRIRVMVVVEARRFVARAAKRARTADRRSTPLSYRLLTEAETATLLGGELLAALSNAIPARS
jgi:hypothetical protein